MSGTIPPQVLILICRVDNENLPHNDIWIKCMASKQCFKITDISNNKQLILSGVTGEVTLWQKGLQISVLPLRFLMFVVWVHRGWAIFCYRASFPGQQAGREASIWNTRPEEKENWAKPKGALRAGSDLHYFSPSVSQIKLRSQVGHDREEKAQFSSGRGREHFWPLSQFTTCTITCRKDEEVCYWKDM